MLWNKRLWVTAIYCFLILLTNKSFELVQGNREFHAYGGTFLALAGKDSVVLATDSRYSSPFTHNSHFLLGHYPRNIYRIGSKTLIGCYGLEAHEHMLISSLENTLASYEDKRFNSENIAKLVANVLYSSQGFFLSPLVLGINEQGETFICSMDGLGAQTKSRSFAVVGSAQSALLAICESLYQQDLEAEELVSLAERCLQLAFQRDVLSGGNIKIVTLRNGEFYSKEVDFTDI